MYELFVTYCYFKNDVTENISPENLVNLLFLANEYLADDLQLLCELSIGRNLHLFSSDQVSYLCDAMSLQFLPLYSQRRQYELKSKAVSMFDMTENIESHIMSMDRY